MYQEVAAAAVAALVVGLAPCSFAAAAEVAVSAAVAGLAPCSFAAVAAAVAAVGAPVAGLTQ